MKICDVNVMIYAHKPEASSEHSAYATWFSDWAENDPCIGISEEVLTGFIRIVTHPKIFSLPPPLSVALSFCRELTTRPNAQILRPGPRNWDIFSDPCEKTQAKGNLVSDIKHAALAIEWGATWVTTDKNFKRIPDVHWVHPLEKF